MKTAAAVTVLAAAGSAAAQSNGTICDRYTAALLGNVTAANEYAILKYIVNTAVIGNSAAGVPKPAGINFPTNVTVTGILNNGTYMGTPVNLLPYFDGGLASSNRGGMAYAVNFLDDGGAAPLTMNNPANGTSSNQYKLLTHLYQYFGTALGCTAQSNSTTDMSFPAYSGVPSMYSVHQFMDLDEAQLGYFIEQVGLSAASFGVSMADITTVANLLNSTFGGQCAGAATVIPKSAGPQLQSICIASDCPVAANASVSSCPYAAPYMAGIANPSLAAGLGNSSNTATASYTGGASMASSMSGMMSSATSPSTTSGSGGSGTAPSGSMTSTATGSTTSPSSGAADVKVAGSFITALFAAFAFAL